MDKTQSTLFKFALFAIAATTVLGPTLIAPSLPELQAHFGDVAYADTLSKFILTTPALFIMIFSPIVGFIYERFGRLKFILIALVAWSLVGASGFLATNLYMLLFSRALFGIATAFITTGIGALIGDYYQGIAREKMLSAQNFFMAFGGACFLTIGGYLANLNWRFPFLVYLLGLVIVIIAATQLFEPTHNTPCQKAKHKAVRFDFLKFAPVYFFGFFSMAIFYIMPTQIPFFITEVLGKSGSQVGISMATASIAMACFGLLYNRLRGYLSIFKISSLALFLMASGFMCIGIFHNYIMLLVALCFIGAGLGFFLVNNSSWLFMLANDNERAKAYGFLASFIFMGQFSSPFFTQPLVRYFGLIHMLLICGGVIYIMSIVMFFYKSKNLKTSRADR